MLFWNMILRMILEGYVEYAVAAILNVMNVSISFLMSLDEMDHGKRLNIFSVFHHYHHRDLFLPLFRLGLALEKVRYIGGSCNHKLFRIYLLRTED